MAKPAPRGALARAVDGALGAVGLARRAAVRGRSVYAGASISRLTRDWVAQPLSADQAIRGDLQLLRDRSRQLVRDNAYAQRYVELLADNVIGPDGIQLQALVKDGEGALDRATNAAIEAAWDDWCLPEHASVDGLLSFTDVATLAVQVWKQDGEALLRLWDAFPNRHGFAVQVLDADLLDHTLNRAAADGVTEIRMGVERNQWGAPIAYHLWTRHPHDVLTGTRQRERVPAADIIHLYTVRRPGQTRGVPAFACVMADLNMLAGYQEAELVAARTAAANMFFITQDKDAEGDDPDAPASIPTEAEPGTGWKLGPGENVAQFNPEHPVSAFGQFVSAVMRAIATGLGVSYSALTGDLSQANYGSLRDGSLKERDGYKRAQRWLAVQLYRRVFLRWQRMAVLHGALTIRAAQRARATEHRWLPRGWPWIDPQKDLTAAGLELAYRLNTRGEICAASGRDFETVLEQTAEEEKLAAEFGVSLALPASAAGPGGAAPADDDATPAAKHAATPDRAAGPRAA